MHILEYMLNVYKSLIEERQEEEIEITPVEYIPKEGDIIEVFPSPDGLEMIFLIYKIYNNGMVEIIPLSRFWEFATPTDALIEIHGTPYIAQTDLALTLPKDDFHKRFGRRMIIKLDSVKTEILKDIENIIKGNKKGAGNISGGIKKEFKILEAKRYFPIFEYNIASAESIAILNDLFASLKEQYPVAAKSQEDIVGEINDLQWMYHEEKETLILFPPEHLINKCIEIYIDLKDKPFTIFKGIARDRIEIYISRENFSSNVIKDFLRIKTC